MKKIFIFSGTVAAILVGTIFGANVLFSVSASNNEVVHNNRFPTNDSGLTYGSTFSLDDSEKEPDLILVQGINGKTGYAYSKDLNQPIPQNSEEAVLYMRSLEELNNRGLHT